MKKRKKYTEEFKKDAVRLMVNRGTRTVEEVAAGLGVNANMLYRWQQQYGDVITTKQRPQSSQEQENVEQLRRRLRQLEQENALLKKAAAFFAKENL